MSPRLSNSLRRQVAGETVCHHIQPTCIEDQQIKMLETRQRKARCPRRLACRTETFKIFKGWDARCCPQVVSGPAQYMATRRSRPPERRGRFTTGRAAGPPGWKQAAGRVRQKHAAAIAEPRGFTVVPAARDRRDSPAAGGDATRPLTSAICARTHKFVARPQIKLAQKLSSVALKLLEAMERIPGDVILMILRKLAVQDPLSLLKATCVCRLLYHQAEKNSYLWKEAFLGGKARLEEHAGEDDRMEAEIMALGGYKHLVIARWVKPAGEPSLLYKQTWETTSARLSEVLKGATWLSSSSADNCRYLVVIRDELEGGLLLWGLSTGKPLADSTLGDFDRFATNLGTEGPTINRLTFIYLRTSRLQRKWSDTEPDPNETLTDWALAADGRLERKGDVSLEIYACLDQSKRELNPIVESQIKAWFCTMAWGEGQSAVFIGKFFFVFPKKIPVRTGVNRGGENVSIIPTFQAGRWLFSLIRLLIQVRKWILKVILS